MPIVAPISASTRAARGCLICLRVAEVVISSFNMLVGIALAICAALALDRRTWFSPADMKIFNAQFFRGGIVVGALVAVAAFFLLNTIAARSVKILRAHVLVAAIVLLGEIGALAACGEVWAAAARGADAHSDLASDAALLPEPPAPAPRTRFDAVAQFSAEHESLAHDAQLLLALARCRGAPARAPTMDGQVDGLDWKLYDLYACERAGSFAAATLQSSVRAATDLESPTTASRGGMARCVNAVFSGRFRPNDVAGYCAAAPAIIAKVRSLWVACMSLLGSLAALQVFVVGAAVNKLRGAKRADAAWEAARLMMTASVHRAPSARLALIQV